MNLGKNGHFTDLTIERWLAGETRTTDVENHFINCELCRSTVEKIDAIPIPIPAFSGNTLPKPLAKKSPTSSRTRQTIIIGLVSILGVFLAVKFNSADPKDEIRIKGRSFSTLLYGKNGDSVRPLFNGSSVNSGERIGFRFENKKKGFLAIVGVDDSGESYVCFPQSSPTAQFIDAGKERSLKEAIRLDSKLGKERIVSIFCETPFSLEDVKVKMMKTRLVATDEMFPPLLENCEQSEVILEKK